MKVKDTGLGRIDRLALCSFVIFRLKNLFFAFMNIMPVCSTSARAFLAQLFNGVKKDSR